MVFSTPTARSTAGRPAHWAGTSRRSRRARVGDGPAPCQLHTDDVRPTLPIAIDEPVERAPQPVEGELGVSECVPTTPSRCCTVSAPTRTPRPSPQACDDEQSGDFNHGNVVSHPAALGDSAFPFASDPARYRVRQPATCDLTCDRDPPCVTRSVGMDRRRASGIDKHCVVFDGFPPVFEKCQIGLPCFQIVRSSITPM